MKEIRQVYLQQMHSNSKRWITKVGFAYSLGLALVAVWKYFDASKNKKKPF